jgi:ABC-type glycerol-3-phosphate transport system permease component
LDTVKRALPYIPLIIACITIALPLSTWGTKGLYDTIPISLDEAAKIDVCGRFRTLLTIIYPLISSGVIAVAMYVFMASWDDLVEFDTC